MLRRIVVSIVCLAAFAVLAPGVVGLLAERYLDENLRWFDAENDDVDIVSLGFERGWFTSTARHRVAFHNPELVSLGGSLSAGRPLEVRIDSRLHHGPLPWATWSSDEIPFALGLANAVSTLAAYSAAGEAIELPGQIYSHLSLSGNSTFRYRAAQGSRETPAVSAHWEGADVVVSASAARRTLGVEGHVDPLRIQALGSQIRVGAARFDSERDASDRAFGVGHLKADLEDAEIRLGAERPATLEALSFAIDSALDGDALVGSVVVRMDDLQAPQVGAAKLDAELTFQGVDAETVVRWYDTMRHHAAGSVGTNGLDAPWQPAAVHELLQHGGRLELTRFSAVLNDAEVRSSGFVRWPAVATMDEFSWPSLLLRTEARAQLELDSELYAVLAERVPQLVSLVALGFLQERGGRYEMDVELDGGLLEVNGAPMPLSGFL